MPCPFATELARSTDKFHAVQKERALAAKNNPSRLAQLDRLLVRLGRAHDAAVRNFERAQKRSSTQRLEAAE